MSTEANNPPAKHDPYAALKVIPFRNYQLSRFLLTFAIQMAETILMWRVYDITGSMWALGLIPLCEVIPSIITAFFGGHAADTYNRYKIAKGAILAIALSFTIIGLFLTGHIGELTTFGLVPIYFMVGFTGVARGFLGPAQQSIFPQLLPRNLYANGATWGSNTWQTAAVFGPALGGIIYGYATSWGLPSVELTFGLAVLLMLISFYLFTRIPETATPPKEKKESFVESLTVGLKFVFNKQIMLSAISLDLFAVLFGGAVALLPVFAKDILHIGPQGMGLLRAAPFLGSVAMGFFLAYFPPTAKAGRNILIAVTGFGLATIGFALSENFILSFAMLFLTGAFDNISVVIRQTILQVLTPDNMRGRVSAVNQIFIASSNEIGGFESNAMAEIMGVVPSVVFGGCMTLVVVIVTYFFVPQMRRLENLGEHTK